MSNEVPRRRSKRSHLAILEAAASLLTERGYASVTIDGIAAAAGVGKTTIYRWYPTKAAIFMELYAKLASEVTPPADSGSVATDLALLLKGTFKLYRETAAGLALCGIIAEAQSNAVVSRILMSDFAPSRRQVIISILSRGVARGEIPASVDIDLVSEVLAGAAWYCLLVGSGPLSDRHAALLSEQVLRGVLPNTTDGGNRGRSAVAKKEVFSATAKSSRQRPDKYRSKL